MAAGWGGMVFRGMQGPTPCGREPVVAGLWYAAYGRTVWLGFACEQHAGQLVAARALLPRDRDTLHRRRDRHRPELAGRRWAGEQEGPLARGAAAERLIERAQAWAQRHPNDTPHRPEHEAATQTARSDPWLPAQ
jgi:hypothetical protein